MSYSGLAPEPRSEPWMDVFLLNWLAKSNPSLKGIELSESNDLFYDDLDSGSSLWASWCDSICGNIFFDYTSSGSSGGITSVVDGFFKFLTCVEFASSGSISNSSCSFISCFYAPGNKSKRYGFSILSSLTTISSSYYSTGAGDLSAYSAFLSA